ncbi:MAG: hypothetical protein R3200_00190 [Xanthomonadales bacterium]|nr:hypothetical protein [Xanthomonadales bacterium]
MASLRAAAGLWAVAGFSLLLIAAIERLLPHALDALSMPLGLHHLALLAANLLFMLYSEGYRGFQRSFSPRFAARVADLRRNGDLLRGVLAPFYCMGYFGAGRRQTIVTWSLTTLIVLLVITFRLIPQPWRGVLDAGVVAGLIYGLLATWYWTALLWNTREEPVAS